MRRQRSKNAERETTPTTLPLLMRTPDDNPISRSQSEESADSGVSALQSRKSSQGVCIRTWNLTTVNKYLRLLHVLLIIFTV